MRTRIAMIAAALAFGLLTVPAMAAPNGGSNKPTGHGNTRPGMNQSNRPNGMNQQTQQTFNQNKSNVVQQQQHTNTNNFRQTYGHYHYGHHHYPWFPGYHYPGYPWWFYHYNFGSGFGW